MNKFLLTVMLMLTGCAAIDDFQIARWDNDEYSIITHIRLSSDIYKAQCNRYDIAKFNSQDLANQTLYFQYYEEQLPHNTDTIHAALSLNQLAQELKDRYATENTVSDEYCVIKLSGIENSSIVMQHSIGNRPK